MTDARRYAESLRTARMAAATDCARISDRRGVQMFLEGDRVMYVGKAATLRERLMAFVALAVAIAHAIRCHIGGNAESPSVAPSGRAIQVRANRPSSGDWRLTPQTYDDPNPLTGDRE